nr:hypothetical protein BaRGS_021783 [Batillaria attramentaria]
MFLYHQIDQHNARISVFPCNFCEYASRYKHKLARHITFAHKVNVSMDDMTAENLKPAGASKSSSGVKFSKTRKTASSIAKKKKKSLSSLLGKLKGKGKAQVADPRLAAFYIDLSTQKQAGSGPSQGTDHFKCKLCLFTGKSKGHVVRHIYACHINGRVFRCNLCSFKTQSSIEFYAHKKKHSTKNATVFKCKECSYATDFKPNFVRHMFSHGANKPNKCSLCSYATDHEGALKRHVTSHHPNTAHNTSLVAGDEISTVDLPELDEGHDLGQGQEELQSDGFRCPICSSLYRRCADLNRHMKSKHNIRRKDFFDDPEQEGDSGEEECIEMADDEFPGETMGDEELGSDDEEDFEDMEDDDEESRPLADLVTRHKGHLKNKKGLKCSYCSYIAKWPSDLRRHLRVHSVEKRFKCSLCWKKYKYLGDLNVHLRRDHEVDPDSNDVIPEKVAIIPIKKNSPSLFRCPTCPFATRFKAEMDRHRRGHTEQKSYLCRMCDYQTYWRGDMGRHLYRRHPEQVSKDADISEYFEFHPERKALSKTKAGRESRSKTPEVEDVPEAPQSEPEEKIEESVPDATSPSTSSSTGFEVARDKDGNKIWKCNHCSYVVNCGSKMRTHVDTHYNLKQFKCPICGQRANWKYDIRKHMTVKHPGCEDDVITLSVEEAKATIEEYMNTMPNIRRDHHFNSGELPVGEKCSKKPYKCSVCSFRSDYRWSVSKHQRTSHAGQTNIGIIVLKRGSIADEESSEQSTSSQNTNTKTKPQDKQASETYDLSVVKRERRSREVAVHEEYDDGSEDKTNHPYQCAECGKTGASKGAIKKHYNYIHPNNEVCIVNREDGAVFNYYTGLPMEPPSQTAVPKPPTPVSGKDKSPNSKAFDPKTHGYVKPFQCSVCGQRSNWKWDVKKHLRIKHPGVYGYVIVLQIDQARATFPGRQYCAVTPSDASSITSSSSGTSSRHGKMHKERDESPNSMDDFDSPNPDMPYKSQEMMMGRYRRYKCSNCGYRSNWRTDVVRHIERLHNNTNARLIFLDVETAKRTFMDYDYKPAVPFVSKGGRERPMASPTAIGKLQLSCTRPLTSKPSSKLKKEQPLQGKVWYCPKCTFSSSLKSHILEHMQSHGMKAFHCSQCRFACRFRSPLYRHIRSQHNTTEYSKYAKIIIKFFKPAHKIRGNSEGGPAQYVDAYLCRMCNTMESESKDVLMKHLQEKHDSSDPNQALRVRKRLGAEDHAARAQSSYQSTKGKAPVRRYFCTICPYRTDKRGMLTFHHAYHQPSSQNKFKCKYCPYYVCAPRLLHQHMKWHDEFMQGGTGAADGSSETGSWRRGGEKTPPSSPSKRGRVMADTTPKRHNCEKCPYTTNSKNDFIYHKQFHRPKPAAEFKCDHCDYWVTHRRLLKQHARLHGEFFVEEESVAASPNKSLASDASAVLDAVEIAAIKQKMIATKITASLSTSPAVSPMKIATQCSVGNRPGFVLRNGMYRKLHQCRKCPYTNIRARNLRLHELMHGARKSDHPLMKCPYCDYYVGSKGLLSHHMKVHLQHYLPDPGESTTFNMEQQEGVAGSQPILMQADEDDMKDVFASPDIPQKHKVDTLLEISRFKRYSCEKCPYASAKRSHFTRHMELHGSRQRHTCEYCDYSVPSASLLTQHRKIHLMPNQNLLATQSFSNLQHLNEVPADVALASALPPTDSAEPVTISVIHDHLELYENDETNSFDSEPKKLYRCDRCPYANVRRDHLLTHLRFHMQRSSFHCPYCDYSVPKQQLLTQHIRVHFCPLPELSDWLIENGQTERAQEVNDVDLTRALEVAEKYQKSPKRKLHPDQADGQENGTGNDTAKKVKTEPKEGDSDCTATPASVVADTVTAQEGTSTEASATATVAGEEKAAADVNAYICQYCDREFATSKQLISHEMQHLIGNHFEFAEDAAFEGGAATQESQVEENPEPVEEISQDDGSSTKVEAEKVSDETMKMETTEQHKTKDSNKDANVVHPDEEADAAEVKMQEETNDAEKTDASHDKVEPETEEKGSDEKMDVSVEEEEDEEVQVSSRRQLRPRGDGGVSSGSANSNSNGSTDGAESCDTSKKDVKELNHSFL